MCPEPDFFGVGDILQYASDKLSNSLTSKTSTKEQLLVDRLTTLCESTKQLSDLQKAVSALTGVALRWKSCDAWLKAVNACADDLKLQATSIEGFVDAYKLFGFQPLKALYVFPPSLGMLSDTQPCADVFFRSLFVALANEPTNLYRFSVIRRLQESAEASCDNSLIEWCGMRWEELLRSLRTPMLNDVDLFVALTQSRGLQLISEMCALPTWNFSQLKLTGNAVCYLNSWP